MRCLFISIVEIGFRATGHLVGILRSRKRHCRSRDVGGRFCRGNLGSSRSWCLVSRCFLLYHNRGLGLDRLHIVLLLELFQPSWTVVGLELSFRDSRRHGKVPGLIANDLVGQGRILSSIPDPDCESALNVRELSFRTLHRRSTAVIGIEVLVLLPEDFGDGAISRVSRCFQQQQICQDGMIKITFFQHQTWLGTTSSQQSIIYTATHRQKLIKTYLQ